MARAARRNPGNIQSPDPILPSATLPSKDAGGAPPPPVRSPEAQSSSSRLPSHSLFQERGQGLPRGLGVAHLPPLGSRGTW